MAEANGASDIPEIDPESEGLIRAVYPEGRARLARIAIGTGYGAWAGLRITGLSVGLCTLTFAPRREMLTPWGSLNGGVVSSLVEVPAFLALLTELDDGVLPVTNDIFVQHMRPLPGNTDYSITGRLIRRGRSMAWVEAEVSAGGVVVTLARITKTLMSSAGG